MRHKKTPAPKRQNGQPDNLLDLNRSLPNYAYHPASSQGRTRTAPVVEKRPKKWKKILLWVVSIIIAIGLVAGGWVAWKILRNELKIFGWGGITSLFNDEKLKGEDSGRVNILLAGNSADDANHGGASLTDSIMVVSIDTVNNKAFMLSVPRDLYVNIPDNGYAKINEAYQDGEADKFSESGYASGGMGLLEKTISEHFDMPIHYYALVDYAAVRQAVDAVGGVDVTIASTDPRGLYDPSPDLNNNYKPLVKLSNGTNHLNGVQALGLARARGDHYGAYGYGTGDFTRTTNQRALLLALKNKATSSGTLTNPVKLGELFDSLGNNVKTDLTLGNVKRLYSISKKIPDSAVTSVGLNDADGKNLLISYRTRTGQSALVPRLGVDDFSEIQGLIAKLTTPPTTQTTQGSNNQ
jgi:LCP family protein required for cell wall assembly